jgi:hypothetical protein
MSRWSDLKELIAPASVRHSVAPPLEAGLRPNDRLERAALLAQFDPLGVDDIVAWRGDLVATAGRRLVRLAHAAPEVVASFHAPAGALAVLPQGLAVAVHATGIVVVDASGGTRVLTDDPRVRSCVTAMCVDAAGDLLVTVGSAAHTEWERALMMRDATGLLLKVDAAGGVRELALGLAWPAGVAVEPGGGILLSESNEHAVRRRDADGRAGRTVLVNLPGYPGRIATAQDGTWWAAMPYLRSRATELMFEFPSMVTEMVTTTEVDSWLVPRLRIEVPRRAPLQVGELSVLGKIKPWAPTRTYGLAFRFAGSGQIIESAHSRADGHRHGATGVAAQDGRVVVAVRGAGCVVEIGQGEGR